LILYYEELIYRKCNNKELSLSSIYQTIDKKEYYKERKQVCIQHIRMGSEGREEETAGIIVEFVPD